MCALKRPASPRREVGVEDAHEPARLVHADQAVLLGARARDATRHADAWQRARVQAGSSTQSSDYRDAGSHTSSCESAPSSSCRSSCHRVPAGRIWGCHWTAIRRCGAPPMWFAACRSPWASCQQNWTWPWLPTEPQSGANGFAPEGVKSGQISAQGPLF